MQLNKSIKIFINYFLGPIIFVWLCFSIYSQIKNQAHLGQSWSNIKESFQSIRVIYILIAGILIFVNWGIEAFKWKLLVKSIHPLKFFQAFKAVLSGVSFSVTMPNRIGEYVGRMMYMPEGSRLRTVSAAIVGSISQLIITLFAGIIGLLILKNALMQAYPQVGIWYQFSLFAIVFIFFIVAFFYFNVRLVSSIFSRWFKSDRYYYLVEALSNYNKKFLLKLLLLSFIRYAVFLLQYLLVFYLFDINLSSIIIAASVSVIFLALAVIPSIALIEIGLRGEVSLWIIGIFTMNTLAIALTSVTVWFINLIIPAIIGSIFMLMIKWGRKEDVVKENAFKKVPEA